MFNRSSKVFVAVVVFLIILAGTFSGGFIVGQIAPSLLANKMSSTTSQNSTPGSPTSTAEDLDTLFQPFWEAWKYVESDYVDQPVDKTKMMRGAISGMLESLGDKHTSYMDPETFQQQNAPLLGEYEGIGAWVDVTGEYLTIVSPMPGSPAEEMGLKPEDQIQAVDGEDMTGIAGDLFYESTWSRTNQYIDQYRPSTDETFDVTITRRKIEIPSVTSKMLDDNIAYIQLANFGEKTHDELKQQLKTLLQQNPKGLILDLRNNGGGYLNAAIDVASEFVDKSPIMFEEFGDGQRITYNAKASGIGTAIPLVVLINEGTASASEITAGAIQDYERGVLVGTQSYGKDSSKLDYFAG